MNDDKYSINKLSEFLAVLPSLEVVGENTAKNLRTVPKFLEPISEDATQDTTDMRRVDADAVLRSYIERFGSDSLSESSIRSYRSRIQQAINVFVKYTDDPKALIEREVMATEKKQHSRRKPQQVVVEDVTTFDLPVPLRSGLTVTIKNLPRDLTKGEAKFISNIIETYGMFEDITKE